MIFNKDNSKKFKSGFTSNLKLSDLLTLIEKDIPKLNIEIKKGYKVGYPNFEKQFKMDYQIIFHDFEDEIWLVKSTNSIRSDRIYGNEFFAQNIRKIDKKVSRIFVVIPDSSINKEKELKQKIKYSSKILSEKYKSFLDNILTFSELRSLLLEYAASKISQGVRSNVLGNDAETSIVNLLNDKDNWVLWNNYEKYHDSVKSSTYNMFIEILKAIGLSQNKDNIVSIEATNKIPKLINGGNPKTDVKFEIRTNTVTSVYTISIKNTTEERVTIHEGSIEDVIYSLEIEQNSFLAEALREFQKYGSFQDLKKNNLNAYKILESELNKFNRELINLFYFGVNSPLLTAEVQIADMILYTNKFEIFTRKSYIEKYIQNYSKKGQLGTPFKWTYPSGKKGKKIQIKGFTNN